MDKEALLKLNRIPDGKPPWLSYKAFRQLLQLFDKLPPPKETKGLEDENYLRLYDFISDVAGINLPESQDAVHVNAFFLIRRGYRVEEITEMEYVRLSELLKGTEEAYLDDMELHDLGNHRALYTYLSEGLGLFVEPGRGPVWHRARKLAKHYESTRENTPTLENSP